MDIVVFLGAVLAGLLVAFAVVCMVGVAYHAWLWITGKA
jgi:hypothetical protein